jgi:hypothetical protein
MIVCYFNFVGVPASPEKADTPLIVDPDAILSFAITLQSLQSVARRHSEILKVLGPVKVQELSTRNPFYRAKLRHIQIIEEFLGSRIAEGPDHHG